VITVPERYTQTDGQTTCDRNTVLCTKVHRAVKTDSALPSQLKLSAAASEILTACQLMVVKLVNFNAL